MLQFFTDWLTFNFLKLTPNSSLGESLNFFIYDTIKILLLVFSIVAIIAFLRTFLPPQGIKNFLEKQKYGRGNILAAMFGAITPFCSCSSIPLFIGFLEAEMPIGIAFSFLATSPLVNEVVFVLMGSKFGWKIAALYALSGILLGIFAGILIEKLKLEKEILINFAENKVDLSKRILPKKFKDKLIFALKEGNGTLRKLWWVIVIGVGIGAAVHGYVPQALFENQLGINSRLAVPIVTLVGVPIYANCATVVPFAVIFIEKGIPLGTALAFLMSIAGLSLPEAVMLKRILSLKLLGIFFGIVAFGIILIGLLFNLTTG